jgi:hypothetical protein
MALGAWLRKRLPFILCSSILLGIQCPPIVVDSVKTGVVQWVSGSFSLLDLTALSDLVIGLTGTGTTTGL